MATSISIPRLFHESRAILRESTRKIDKKQTTELLNCALHLLSLADVEIEDRVTFLAVTYRPKLRYDRLRLQEIRNPAAEPLGIEFRKLQNEINSLAHGERVSDRVDSRNDSIRAQWLLDKIPAIMAAHKALARTTKSRQRRIAKLQSRQGGVVMEIRALNSAWFQAKRAAVQSEKRALEEGRFWECRESLLKNYFRVPFDKRKLIDVSSQHRAALFVECILDEYTYTYKKLVAGNRAYLCGIDDNGEEWGFVLRGHWDYDDTVTEAMAVAWEVDMSVVKKSRRQGELLFYPCNIPEGIDLEAEAEWQVAPSHTMKSATLSHNGDYFSSREEVVVEHPTHAPVVLPAGEYRVYAHEMDPD